MSRFVFVKLAVAVAIVCGLAASASAQLSGQLAGGGIKLGASTPAVAPAPAVVAPATNEKAPFLTPDLVKALPRLGSNFTILAPASKDYNAYAYGIGVTDRWIDVKTGSPENPLSEMDKLLVQSAYQRSDTLDTSPRRGVQKLVVYATMKADGDVDQIQSVAVQMPGGGWSAKIGGMAVIGFAKPEQLCGPNYGRVLAVYEREDVRGNAQVSR